MEEMNIEKMSLSEMEMKADELKESMSDESLSEEERKQIEKTIMDMQDRIEILRVKFDQAMWRGARMEPPTPMM